MTSGVEPAVPDSYWLEADELYLARGSDVEIDRPIYQGDVFSNVPVVRLPKSRPTDIALQLNLDPGGVMIVPHPCQCYHGDNLRSYLTVAPVRAVDDPDKVLPGPKDKFPLLDLPVKRDDGTWSSETHVADFGRLFSIPSRWLNLHDRVACLSHKGIGLLAKRMIDFQLRHTISLVHGMTFAQEEWAESFLMQAWVRKHGNLKGYSAWMRTEVAIPGVGASGDLVTPYSVRAGALDALMELITGEPIEEAIEGPTG